MNRYEFTSHDGKIISVVEWLPEGEIKGIIQIAHGMAEHAMRYEEFAKRMNLEHFLVFADDHRAHGKTEERTLGFAEGDIFADTLADMNALALKYKENFDRPLILFGHSYGSFLVQAYIQKYTDYDGVIIGGSGKMKKSAALAGKIVASAGCIFGRRKKPAKFIKKMTFDAYDKKVGGSFISSIPAEAKRYEADPFCGFVCSNAFYKSFMNGLLGSYTKKGLSKIDKNKPVLLIAGSEDPVGEMGKSMKKLRDMYNELGVRHVYLIMLPDTRHEYFNDLRKEEAYAAVVGFAYEIISGKNKL